MFGNTGSTVGAAALSLMLVVLIKDREPSEQMDNKQETLISPNQKESDSSSLDENNQLTNEKCCVVVDGDAKLLDHAIDAEEDLHKYNCS